MTTIVLSHYKAQGIWTARAYVTANGISTDWHGATSESSAAEAKRRLIRRIQDGYAQEGLPVPINILDRGRQPAALVDAYKF